MPQQPGVTQAESPSAEDERLKNLQAEFSRKLDKTQEEMTQRIDALMQKLDSLTVNTPEEPAASPVDVNEQEELRRISARPRGYVEDIVRPVKEETEQMKKIIDEQNKLIIRSRWERMEDRIARAEGKKDWNDLPDDFTKEIKQEIVKRGWQGNPESAMDAYDIVRSRKSNGSDPDRLNRIRDNQPESTGRRSGVIASQVVTKTNVAELASTPPSHPDYKKNMETLDKVQKGQIKVEG